MTEISQALKDHRMSAEQYYILSLLDKDKDSLLPYLRANVRHKDALLRNLYRRGFIDVGTEDVWNLWQADMQLTSIGKEVIKVKEEKQPDIDWIEEWYELWPAGVKSGGYYVKSDKAGCKKKMLKFIKAHPEFDKETIIKATNNYLNRMASKGFEYMQLAGYFIEKNDSSTLAAECEATLNSPEPSLQSFTKDI